MRALSFRARSVFFVLATSAVAVTLACTAFLAYDRVTYRDGLVDRLRSHSVVVGTNTTAALSFGDHETARQLLGALEAEPIVEAACLYDASGHPVASYIRSGGPGRCPARPSGEAQSVVGEALLVESAIGHQHEVIGSVVLISDLDLVDARTLRFLAIVTVVMIVSLIAAFVMATRLMGAVVRPVLTLAETAKHVSRTRDYSVRAAPHSSADEVGALTEAFNAMLDQIGAGERALQAARADLERRVVDRTRDLEDAVLSAERVAESLRMSEEQFRFLSDHVPVGIFRTDATGIMTYGNQRLLDVLGMDSLASAVASWEEVVHPDDLEGVLADWSATLSSGAEMARELRFMVAGEVRWVAVQTRQLFDANGRPQIVGTVADVTERKQAERERERMSIERLEMSRQSGMAEVATGVLHNVGNVLNSVNVASSVLQNRIRNSSAGQLGKVVALLEQNRDRLADYLTADPRGVHLMPFLSALAGRLDGERGELLGEMTTITENIEHIKQIIATQQTFARSGGLIELVDLRELIDGAVAVSLPETGAASHSIHIERDYQAFPPVNLDKHKVLQVLINLLSNAKHALLDSKRDDRRIVIRSRLNGGGIRIEVEDNGVGIAPDNLERIFRFGFTTKDKGHGFGLHGSALAAKQLHGSLVVHSDGPGLGAVFALEFPSPPGYRAADATVG